MKYRIVEERRIEYISGIAEAKPVFYCERGKRFLFWWIWNRYLYSHTTKDEAIYFLEAVKQADNFKKIIQ